MSNIYIDDRLQLERANKLLAGLSSYGGRGSPVFHAVGAALKRAAISARAKAGLYASEEYEITSGTFKGHTRDKIIIEGDHNGVDGVKLSFAGSVLRLIEYKTRFTRDGGVSVTVKRGHGGVLQAAFIPENMPLGVYERITSSRLPIEQKYGPSTAHMMMADEVETKMQNHVVKVFNERIEHEITRVLNGW